MSCSVLFAEKWLGVFSFVLSIEIATAAPEAPVFEAGYESPFGAIRGYHRTGYVPDPDGQVLFRIWKEADSDFLSGHFRGATRDCGGAGVHFCIEGGYLKFAAPPADADANWSWRIGDEAFSVASRQKTRFRGQLVDTITVRRNDAKFETNAAYFVYNYDIGVIAFAEFRAEAIRPTEPRMPDILEAAMVLGGDEGLGGREYCNYWKCGTSPQEPR